MVNSSSKLSHRVFRLTHFGAKVSYIDKSSMDINELEPKDGSVPIADIEQDSHLLCFDYYDISIIQGIVIPKLTDDTPRINFR